MSPTNTGSEVRNEPLPAEALAEKVLITAMAVNPLISLDRTQLAAAAGRVGVRAVLEPMVFARVVAGVGRELTDIALGRSKRAPEPADKRWADPAFQSNPVYHRVMQGYLAVRAGVQRLVDEVHLDPKSRERGRFALNVVTEALAPTNTLLGNPAAIRRALDTRAKSLVSGVRHLAADLKENGGLPSQVDRRPFRVGENLATTPGRVVFRNEVLELLQYRPATPRVFERPVLFIPPQINKFYILDLAPARSLIEFTVQQGFQVFAVSWRNATPAQREWNFDTYVGALKEASDAVVEIAGSKRLNLIAACAGGVTSALFLGHLAAVHDDRIGSATFMVTVLDTSVPSSVSLLVSEKSIASSLRRSQERGVLHGSDLGRAFALLRPNDLVWNYWVNNYLMGADPPAFDILYWNNDSTNLPAALHADFLALFLENPLCESGRLEVLGAKIDLGRVTADVYAVGALTDHITPWDACYRTPQLFGGNKTFVASSSGHIQALVNPPPASKSRYFTNDALVPDAKAWLNSARENKGTWWTHWAQWLRARSGADRDAPLELGSAAHPPLMPAPGRYVHQSAG
jgi:polyhydroxyalkanoate synthase subunit PhaC